MGKPTFVSRINQLDAVQLDEEIYKVLKSQTDEITKSFAPGTFVKWRPETELCLKYFIWHYSLKNDNSTFGQRLLNLSYSNLSNRKAVLLFALLSLPNYISKRIINENFIPSWLLRTDQLDNFKRTIDKVENVCQLANFLWTFYFLCSGNQPRLVEAVLDIYNQSSTLSRPRGIGYSYMTRELLWHGLIELFTVSLPMIDLKHLQYYWQRLWSKAITKKNNIIHYKFQEFTKCAYCNQRPILPNWAGCCHVFCYYCLNANFLVAERYTCPVCKMDLHAKDVKNCN